MKNLSLIIIAILLVALNACHLLIMEKSVINNKVNQSQFAS